MVMRPKLYYVKSILQVEVYSFRITKIFLHNKVNVLCRNKAEMSFLQRCRSLWNGTFLFSQKEKL